MNSQDEYRGTTGSYVLIKTAPGKAKSVARSLSLEGPRVRFAVVVTGPYDVVAAVRVPDNHALGEFVDDVIGGIEGITNPTTLVRTVAYKDGDVIQAPINGPP